MQTIFNSNCIVKQIIVEFFLSVIFFYTPVCIFICLPSVILNQQRPHKIILDLSAIFVFELMLTLFNELVKIAFLTGFLDTRIF